MRNARHRLPRKFVAASQEQTTGLNQVNDAVNHLDETTQQNAALVEQAAAAAESLNDQVKLLVRAMGIFRLTEGETAMFASTGNIPGRDNRVPSQKALQNGSQRRLLPAH